jgi:hypothetical protein
VDAASVILLLVALGLALLLYLVVDHFERRDRSRIGLTGSLVVGADDRPSGSANLAVQPPGSGRSA